MEWSGSTFIPQQPENSPKLTKHVQLDQKHHHKFGKPVRHHPKLTPFFTIADTGCQTCTAGMGFLYQMNCEESDTIPTKHKIVGINNTPINITGVLLVTLYLGKRESHQMVYISNDCKGLYLSQTAMKDLPIINKSFPHPVEDPHPINCSIETNPTCNCPKRIKTPPKPEAIYHSHQLQPTYPG